MDAMGEAPSQPDMQISVIIPCLNEAARLPGLLRALSNAGFLEVLVVDGGSEDGSPALALASPHARLLEAPRGRARQMNAGARAARGDVLFFLHADALPPPRAAEHIARALSRPDVVAGAFTLHTVSEGGRWKPWLRVADLRSRWTRHPYGDQGLFVRAEAFRQVGGFPDQPLLEDLELSRRLRRLGRVVTVREDMRVSGRRFEAQPWRSLVFMNVAPSLYRMGVSAEWLKARYEDVR